MKNLNSLFSVLAITLLMLSGFYSNAQSDLVISEIMYNDPTAGSYDSLEFIEIYNKGSVSYNLQNYTIRGGIKDTFKASFTLNPGQYFITCIDTAFYRGVFGVAANREWVRLASTNALNNTSESIVLVNAAGVVLDSVEYKKSGDWPSEPDGDGNSLVLCDVASDNNNGTNWSACTTATGKIVNGNEIKANPRSLGGCDASPVQTVRNRVSFVIFPNPAGNTIQLNMASVKTYEVNITDLFGKVVMTGQTAGLKSTLSVANLPNGMYLLQLIENNTIMGIQKLVISKQ